MTTRLSLLKSLTQKELRELCKRFNLTGYSALKQAELAKLIANNVEIPIEELEELVNKYKTDKMLTKIKDCRDYFMSNQVSIDYSDDNITKANVGGYRITITNLGGEDFAYSCDEKCQDWLYQVKSGRYPFCKHYPAVIAEMISRGTLDPNTTEISLLSPSALSELLNLVEERRIQEGLILGKGRNIEGTLKSLSEDFLAISLQDNSIARSKYHDPAERVFERMVEDAFGLLEFDTVRRRSEHGWDIILIGTHASPPYMVIVECKTAQSGVYDYLAKDSNYLIRLKSYCVDMVQSKLPGAYRDYVKYMTIVAPGFPPTTENLCNQFQRMSGGIKLSFFPVEVLLYLVQCYHENPIIRQGLLEDLFAQEGVIERADIDKLLVEAEHDVKRLSELAQSCLHQEMGRLVELSADSCFLKLRSPAIQDLMQKLISALSPDLAKIGREGVTGIETVNIKHDYYKIWEQVLHGVAKEFAQILSEQSEMGMKSTALKEDILRYLATA